MDAAQKSPHILITGAGKGIGRAIALELARRAHASNKAFAPKLFLTSRTASDLALLERELRGLHFAGEVASLAADLSTTAEVNRVYAFAKNKFGPVQCLVNNAGVGRFGDFKDLTEDDFDFVMATNLKGLFFLTQKAYADMEKAKSGHLLFVTSTAAETAFEQSAIYCMSKFAQKGLLEVLRLYGRKHGIRVTNVMPGPTETPMWGVVDAATQARMMQPEDVALPIVDAILLPQRTSLEEIVLRPLKGDL